MQVCKFPFLVSFALFCLITGFCFAQDTISDRATGKSFPKTVAFDYEGSSYNLDATGVSTRKKFFAKVYSIAHYMEDPASVAGGDVFEAIINSKNAKQLTSIWVRNVSEKKVTDGYRESFGKILSREEMSELNDQINQYLGFFGNVNSNDKHVIRWFPDGTVTVEINGEMKGSIKSEKFARALWNVWLGDRSVVKRDQLISLIP
ncbi:MAG: hypothetical protein K940chlam7_01603 [Chlamydiae bacterium]|nr:hypothetical protein [Chlamydiota bacterium]